MGSMQLYNTLGRQVQTFKPLSDQKVLMYSCGPTVYDYMHIGNLRKFVFDDTLRRTLEASGYNVQQTMNITDVGHLVGDSDEGEDKLERGAKREGKTVWQVADHYIEAFKRDVSLMNILPPNKHRGDDEYSRATDFIPEQVEMVKALLQNGFAYITKQAIYFDTSKLPDYGELTGQKLSDKEVAVRKEVITDQHKHHPQDFAVWFFTVDRFANHDMHWESSWGQGFPGWHLECSAIIHTVLGDPIDIHTGGVDNIGTHHVNEMAQTKAAFGHQLANYWIHNEHLLVDGQRMAKSSGNFYTLADIIKKGFDPLALRLLFLQSHYRTQMNFTWENLEAAQNRLIDIQAFADLRFSTQVYDRTSVHHLVQGLRFDQILAEINNEITNDLNTPSVLSILSGLIDAVKVHGIDNNAMSSFEKLLISLDNILGLGLLESKDIDSGQVNLILERQKARDKKDWAKSDQLRTRLEDQKIGVRDTEYGVQWFRI